MTCNELSTKSKDERKKLCSSSKIKEKVKALLPLEQCPRLCNKIINPGMGKAVDDNPSNSIMVIIKNKKGREIVRKKHVNGYTGKRTKSNLKFAQLTFLLMINSMQGMYVVIRAIKQFEVDDRLVILRVISID